LRRDDASAGGRGQAVATNDERLKEIVLQDVAVKTFP
jgi:hypothetical protein